MIIPYRGSEDSQEVKDAGLAEALRGYLGPGKELGVRPARYLPGGAHKRSVAVRLLARRPSLLLIHGASSDGGFCHAHSTHLV